MVSLLTAMLASGCATRTEYVEVRPQFEIPGRPAVDIDWHELCSRLHAEVACDDPGSHDVGYFEDVQDQIDGLIDWGLELEATLEGLRVPPE